MFAGEQYAGLFSAMSGVGQMPRAVGLFVASRSTMSNALRSLGSEHAQAALDHELAARQHRAAAEFHDRNMLHAARLSAEHAKASCITAHRHSMTACEHSEAVK